MFKYQCILYGCQCICQCSSISVYSMGANVYKYQCSSISISLNVQVSVYTVWVSMYISINVQVLVYTVNWMGGNVYVTPNLNYCRLSPFGNKFCLMVTLGSVREECVHSAKFVAEW